MVSKPSRTRSSTESKAVSPHLEPTSDWAQSVRLPTPDLLSQYRADLNRALSEYNLGHIDEAKTGLTKLSLNLEQLLPLATRESDRTPIHLLYASTQTSLGRIYERSGLEKEARSAFTKAAAEFRKSLPKTKEATDQMYCDYGVALFKVGSKKRTIEAFMEAKKRGVLTVEANRYVGICFERLGKYKEAEEHFGEAIKQDPNDFSTHITFAKFLEKQKKITEAVDEYRSATTYLANSGLFDEALKVLDHTLRLTRQDPQILAFKAEILRVKGDARSALKAVNASLKRKPKDAYAIAVKGLVLLAFEKNDEAIQFLQQAVKLDPTIDWVYVELAVALISLGNYKKALAVLDKSLALQPDNPNALFHKAETLHTLDRTKEALLVLNQALKLTPNDANMLGAKGQCLRELNQYPKALKVLERSIALNPSVAWVHVELGWVLYNLGDYHKALEALNNALAIQPDNFLALRQKGEVLRTLGKGEEALQVLNQAVTLAPNDAWALGTTGQILRDLGRDKEAVDILQQSIKLQPTLAWVYVELSAALYSLGEYISALEELEKALRIQYDSEWQFFKGNILCEIAEFDAAVKALNHSIKNNNVTPDTFGLKGWALQHLGAKYAKDTLEAYQAAVELERNNLWWHKGVANGLYLLGEKRKAAAKYRWVSKQAKHLMEKEKDWVFRSLIGWCEYRLGNWESAVELFNQVVSANPEEIATQFDLALALMCWGHDSEALREYRRGVRTSQERPPLRCRGILYVALDDLNLALDNLPLLAEKSEAKEALALLKAVYDQSSEEMSTSP